MRALALLFVASLGTAHAAIQEEVVTLPAAGGGTLPYLRSSEESPAPRAIAVLFNGGFGNVGD